MNIRVLLHIQHNTPTDGIAVQDVMELSVASVAEVANGDTEAHLFVDAAQLARLLAPAISQEIARLTPYRLRNGNSL